MRRRRHDQRGTSLVEVLIAMTLAVTLMSTVMGTFIAFSRAHDRQAAAIDQRQAMRLALDEISRTLRAGWPLWPAGDAAAARDEVTFSVPDVPGSTATRRLRFDPTAGSVVLEDLDSPDSREVTSTRRIVDGLDAPATAFVRYFTSGGSEIVPVDVDPGTLASCAAVLRITLGRNGSGDDGRSLDMSLDIGLRNVPDGAPTC